MPAVFGPVPGQQICLPLYTILLCLQRGGTAAFLAVCPWEGNGLFFAASRRRACTVSPLTGRWPTLCRFPHRSRCKYRRAGTCRLLTTWFVWFRPNRVVAYSLSVPAPTGGILFCRQKRIQKTAEGGLPPSVTPFSETIGVRCFPFSHSDPAGAFLLIKNFDCLPIWNAAYRLPFHF